MLGAGRAWECGGQAASHPGVCKAPRPGPQDSEDWAGVRWLRDGRGRGGRSGLGAAGRQMTLCRCLCETFLEAEPTTAGRGTSSAGAVVSPTRLGNGGLGHFVACATFPSSLFRNIPAEVLLVS